MCTNIRGRQRVIWTPGAARAARRIATAAAVGGGGLTVLGAMTYGLLLAEGVLARHIVGRPHGLKGPDADGLYGRAFHGAPIRMVLLGDSTSVGLGLTEPRDTPGANLATGLASVAERP